MKTVRHTTTLFYYDGPQVFEARDAIGGHYVAVMVEPQNGQDRYLVAGVEPERLRQFRAGWVDLRSLLAERAVEDWFLALAPSGLDEPLVLQPAAGSLANSEFLPDPGFVLHDRPTEEVALKEARQRNNLVLEVAADPPEAAAEHRIRVNTLIGLLGHVQTMVKHAYGAAVRELSPDNRRAIDKTDAHLMDVVIPAGAGSFRVVLEAAQKPNLVGHSELARALQRVDVLFENASDPQKALATVKAHRGHLAGAYLRLLRFLVQHKTGLRYSWAEPGFTTPNQRAVAEAEAGPLVDVLSGVSNLGGESLTLVGEFEKVNRGTGAWGLLTEDGLVSGKVRDGGPSLDGLKVGARYRFACVEEIEEVEGTGREQRTLYLIEHEPA
ncbi:MAG TPA: DUF6575 domain-containing protein [Verrucomicrobiae bacterium]|nr:DUF6575 domain-containing protein [Verrucomicrobiae bacterium]